MSKLNIICRDDIAFVNDGSDCIGVDGGVKYCLDHKIKMIKAIGDFDTFTDVFVCDGDIIQLPKEKDMSDFAYALSLIDEKYDEIFVYGVLGKRLDHEFNALLLLYQCNKNMHFIDGNNDIFVLNKGEYVFSDKKYYSFYSFEKANFSLFGFKYHLNNYELSLFDTLCLSNELRDNQGIVVVNDGKILVMKTNDEGDNGQD